MIDRELLYDAFYAYEALASLGGMTDKHKEAYKKLREALTQPEQAGYVKKKEWVGLTDEEIENLWGEPVDLMYSGHYNAIRDIEAKLKENNG